MSPALKIGLKRPTGLIGSMLSELYLTSDLCGLAGRLGPHATRHPRGSRALRWAEGGARNAHGLQVVAYGGALRPDRIDAARQALLL